MKLTDEEKTAIAQLKEVAKKWPKSLLIGGRAEDESQLSVWKRIDACECREVAVIPRIKNVDAF